MTNLVLATADKPGMLENLSPTVVFFGSLGLMVFGIILLVIEHKLRANGKSEARELLTFLGWVLGLGSLAGMVYAIFPGIFS